MKDVRFDDQVVIVTGAGGGLGRAYALDLARRGAAVVVNDLGGTVEGVDSSKTMADQVVDEIAEAGGRAIANYDSVASAQGAKHIVDQALREFGRVDALINNAGNMRLGLLEDSCQQDLDALIAVHLMGSYHMTRAVWSHMKQRGYGRIVFTASSAGIFGHEGQGCYGAAKAGVFGLMNGFALEGEPHGILCNVIMPNAFSRMTDKAQEGFDPKEVERSMAMLSKVGAVMQPEFTAGLATYLASDQCSSTHSAYSSCLGRMARVFVGVTEGWRGSLEVPASAEEIATNFERVRDLSAGFHLPERPSDEYRIVLTNAEPVGAGAPES